MIRRSCEAQRREGSGVKSRNLRRLKVSGMKFSVQKRNLYCKHGRGRMEWEKIGLNHMAKSKKDQWEKDN